MKMFEVTGLNTYLTNEEKQVLEKLKSGVPVAKLSMREREVILHQLKTKGRVK